MWSLAAALLIGALVGIEREKKKSRVRGPGHRGGPDLHPVLPERGGGGLAGRCAWTAAGSSRCPSWGSPAWPRPATSPRPGSSPGPWGSPPRWRRSRSTSSGGPRSCGSRGDRPGPGRGPVRHPGLQAAPPRPGGQAGGGRHRGRGQAPRRDLHRAAPPAPTRPSTPGGPSSPTPCGSSSSSSPGLSLIGYVATRALGPGEGRRGHRSRRGPRLLHRGHPHLCPPEPRRGRSPPTTPWPPVSSWPGGIMFVRVIVEVAVVHAPLVPPLLLPMGAMGLVTLALAAWFAVAVTDSHTSPRCRRGPPPQPLQPLLGGQVRPLLRGRAPRGEARPAPFPGARLLPGGRPRRADRRRRHHPLHGRPGASDGRGRHPAPGWRPSWWPRSRTPWSSAG